MALDVERSRAETPGCAFVTQLSHMAVATRILVLHEAADRRDREGYNANRQRTEWHRTMRAR